LPAEIRTDARRGLAVPTVIGLLAFGTGLLTNPVGFEGSAGGFVKRVGVATTIWAIQGCLFTAGSAP
jgi:hypothetical protein